MTMYFRDARLAIQVHDLEATGPREELDSGTIVIHLTEDEADDPDVIQTLRELILLRSRPRRGDGDLLYEGYLDAVEAAACDGALYGPPCEPAPLYLSIHDCDEVVFC